MCTYEEETLLTIRSVWEMSGQSKTPVNLTNMFSWLVQTFMWRIIFGTRISFHGDTRLDGHGEEIKKIATELAASVGAVNIGDFIPCLDWLDLQGVKRRMKKAHKSIDQVISKLIEEHQRRKRKLQKQNDEQQLASKDIIDVLLEMKSFDGMEITE
ncbi:cytochrome P450 750A1-like [Cryptomeria japonica]|uniref:cytochrome P450 750A1-like n=1 Tax=Cryptomeria japonica TaxID=3369 RepID=UPI0027DA011F|nr:cytochrome P450 750A1-like [Cryptomeria japonica]